ncbi:MAG: hypothetical protein AMXMBFR84_27590 [Candidatus Hydrogenedentota bacterium]
MAFRFDGIKVSFVRHDSSPNPRNPFDHLSPGERVARIRRVLARVALRRVADNSMHAADESTADLSEGDDAKTPSSELVAPTELAGCARKASDV